MANALESTPWSQPNRTADFPVELPSRRARIPSAPGRPLGAVDSPWWVHSRLPRSFGSSEDYFTDGFAIRQVSEGAAGVVEAVGGTDIGGDAPGREKVVELGAVSLK